MGPGARALGWRARFHAGQAEDGVVESRGRGREGGREWAVSWRATSPREGRHRLTAIRHARAGTERAQRIPWSGDGFDLVGVVEGKGSGTRDAGGGHPPVARLLARRTDLEVHADQGKHQALEVLHEVVEGPQPLRVLRARHLHQGADCAALERAGETRQLRGARTATRNRVSSMIVPQRRCDRRRRRPPAPGGPPRRAPATGSRPP